MNRPRLLALRVVVIVLATLLGVAFLARGSYVIGALVLALAATRAAMVLTVLRNRSRVPPRFDRRP